MHLYFGIILGFHRIIVFLLCGQQSGVVFLFRFTFLLSGLLYGFQLLLRLLYHKLQIILAVHLGCVDFILPLEVALVQFLFIDIGLLLGLVVFEPFIFFGFLYTILFFDKGDFFLISFRGCYLLLLLLFELLKPQSMFLFTAFLRRFQFQVD